MLLAPMFPERMLNVANVQDIAHAIDMEHLSQNSSVLIISIPCAQLPKLPHFLRLQVYYFVFSP